MLRLTSIWKAKLANFGQILSGHSPVECSLDNWDDCKEVVKNIIKYSTETFPKDVVDGYTRSLNFAALMRSLV